MEEEAKQLLETLTEQIESGIEFRSEQLPLVAEEIVAYSIVSNGICAGIFLVVMLIAAHFFKKLLKFDIDQHDTVFSFIPGAVFVVSFVVFCISVHDLVLAVVAPRLCILKFLGNLVTGN